MSSLPLPHIMVIMIVTKLPVDLIADPVLTMLPLRLLLLLSASESRENRGSVFPGGASECPSPWTRLSRGCYLFITASVSWFQARNQCNNRNGYLAEIESAEEQNKLAAKIQEFPFSRWGYWIGLTETTKEGSWVWDFSGNQPTFTPWHIGQPDNCLNQDCVHMFFGGPMNKDGSWDDESCSRSRNGRDAMGAICELKMGKFYLTYCFRIFRNINHNHN